MQTSSTRFRGSLVRHPIATAVVGAIAAAAVPQAHAFEIDSGSPSIGIRWDNDIRYNLGVRAQKQDTRISDHPVFGSSDTAFDRGDIVTNRLDLLSQLDITYEKDHGVRLSGAAWYDQAYAGKKPPASFFSGYSNGEYSDTVKRYYRGSGELLDAFVFTKVNLGDTSHQVKLGRFASYWGEALFADGVAYSQSPVDVRKAVGNPGVQAKELFLPVAQFSLESQLTKDLSVGIQVPLDWKAARFPESGTYLGLASFGFEGPDQWVVIPGLATASKGPAVKGKNNSAFGAKVRWSPEVLGGAALGAYYRKFDEVYPWVLVGGLNPAFLPTPVPSEYHLAYARNSELVGFSIAGSVSGLSLAAEVAHRRNAALNSVAAPLAEGARGDITNYIVNGIAYWGHSAVFDSASLTAEISLSQLNRITQNEFIYNGAGYAGCPDSAFPGGASAGCSTRTTVAMNISFQPQWLQIAEGLDLTVPINYSRGLKGNSADVAAANHKGAGTYSVGAAFDYQYKHTFTLTYNGYYSKFNHAGALNGSPLRDRGWVSFTYKTSL